MQLLSYVPHATECTIDDQPTPIPRSINARKHNMHYDGDHKKKNHNLKHTTRTITEDRQPKILLRLCVEALVINHYRSMFHQVLRNFTAKSSTLLNITSQFLCCLDPATYSSEFSQVLLFFLEYSSSSYDIPRRILLLLRYGFCAGLDLH
ncbi:hypothetical protein YC2023_113087 [Brassica napus]